MGLEMTGTEVIPALTLPRLRHLYPIDFKARDPEAVVHQVFDLKRCKPFYPKIHVDRKIELHFRFLQHQSIIFSVVSRFVHDLYSNSSTADYISFSCLKRCRYLVLLRNPMAMSEFNENSSAR